MYKGVIFDLDGTLSNTLDSISLSGNLALESIGMASYEKDAYRYFVGDGAKELVRRMLINNGDTECSCFEELITAYRKTFAEHADYNVTVYDGMKETLAELKSKGLKLAVLSNKPHAQTLEVVHKLYGEGTFDVIRGNVPEIKRKPAPDGALLISKELLIEPCELVYVGDTCVDMKTGKSAGMFTVGVLWGFRDRKELEDNKADAIISHPHELLDLITDALLR
ncbi:MAG: HAD family hydrolase [Lachnospiraceae bacterium]|nr:HAD family hydrolase [Lachnospiraceae bacterium]